MTPIQTFFCSSVTLVAVAAAQSSQSWTMQDSLLACASATATAPEAVPPAEATKRAADK